MAYFIKSQGKLDLPKLGSIILQTISTLKYNGQNYRTKQSDYPLLVDSKEERDMYSLGRIIDPAPDFGFDTLFAFNIKHPKALGRCFHGEIAKNLDFFPEWVVMCGIESAHGFDIGPLHKNLSKERLSEAVSLGQKIRREVQGVENLAFVHYYVNNRDIIPYVEKIE